MSNKLTDKQEAFCQEYIIDLNATQAAIRAGYSEKTAKEIGCENLSKPNIQANLQVLMRNRQDSLKVSAEYVLRRLKEIDELDVIDIMLDDLSDFRPLSEWPKTWRTSISGLDLSKMVNGNDEPIETIIKKIKWPDKTKNLELIGRHVSVKAWDKEDNKNDNDKVININFIKAVKPDEH